MKTDAQIICRVTRYGTVCEWEGGKVAEVSGRYLEGCVRPGMVIKVGRLRLRVIVYPTLNSYGAPYDVAQVMLDSPRAELRWLYRQNVERLIRLVLNVEMRVRGFLLQPIEGRIMPFTARVADRLL